MSMNVPNLLTMSRLGLAIILMGLLAVSFPLAKSAALAVFIIAGITDYLDGTLARNRYGVTTFGQFMDPLTDKVVVCAAFVSFVELEVNQGRLGTTALVPAWMVVLIISREFAVTGLRLIAANKGDVISAGVWGKHKTVWQIVAIVVILLGLAIREDILPRLQNAELAKDFDFALGYIALAVTLAVVVITLASGAMYFLEHQEVVRGRGRRRRSAG